MFRKPLRLLLLIAATTLSSCVSIGNADDPIATILVPATVPTADRTLVIVLPGFGSNARDLEKHGIGEAVHQGWPQADVLLTSATFAYYSHRNIIARLDQDIVQPARRQGYKEIWLAGASVGGMGVLFYEHEHPGEMTGLVLLAPWLGSEGTLDGIRKAGGLRQWEPGPVPTVVDNDNYQRELWRVAKDWSGNSALAARVWLICGTNDRLLPTSRLLATAIPPSHYLELPGGSHSWASFVAATKQIVTRIRQPAD